VRDRIEELDAPSPRETIADIAHEFGSSGYVVESVPLALSAARSIDRLPLDVLLRRVIEAGGDTDTIASMTGQIAGAWLGASRIPREMIELLPNAPEIERFANEFASTLTDVAVPH
jgi:ADP-ribosylglycohydrolase